MARQSSNHAVRIASTTLKAISKKSSSTTIMTASAAGPVMSRARPSRCERLAEEEERQNSHDRLRRVEETRKRNAAGQQCPYVKKKRRTWTNSAGENNADLDADAQAFFDSIYQPFLKICGSCGELAEVKHMSSKAYDPRSDFFKPLCNPYGECEIVSEALVTDSDGNTAVLFCTRCLRSLQKRDSPKFCRASGFRIGAIPPELAVLNRMEARLIGLGICFTTCFNLHSDGQEFTHGNAVNYWNDPAKVVGELPRRLSETGIVYLRARSSGSDAYFRVRPYVVRQALLWLIGHNPLYVNISISEANLQELANLTVEAVPSLHVTSDEMEELKQRKQNTDTNNFPYSESVDVNAETMDTINTEVEPSVAIPLNKGLAGVTPKSFAAPSKSRLSEPCALASTLPSSNIRTRNLVSDLEATNIDSTSVFEIEESFEQEIGIDETRTELELVAKAVNETTGKMVFPVRDLTERKETINEYTTKLLFQNCFPTLFPDGQGGLYPLDGIENRFHNYQLAEYCAHLIKWHDRRFVTHPNFKFFCLNLIQRRQIDGLVRHINVLNEIGSAIDDNDNNDCITTENNTSTGMHMLKTLKPFFRSVRGSGLYWSNVREDVMSMIGNRVLPTRWPTFFLTLSAADTIWPDFFLACDPTLTLEQARHLTAQKKRRYLNENPDIAARHFHRRFKAFFENVLSGKAKPLGEIEDYFWRVEFQKRGSPHIHALLWIKDAPDVLKLSETEVGRTKLASYVDQCISVVSKSVAELECCKCDRCIMNRKGLVDVLALNPTKCQTKEWKCDIAHLVERVQQHLCSRTSSCRKNNNACRFGFPKELQDHTHIEVATASDGTPSLTIQLQRESPTINNFSPPLLASWRANMDIQMIGNAYGAAEYTAAYVSKAEPDTARFRKVIAAAVKRCDSNLPNYAIFKRVANATLSIREISAQEAIYTLLRELPMYGKSRKIVKVKVLPHRLRYYRIDPEELTSLTGGDEAGFDQNIIRLEPEEKAYMARPLAAPFIDMSFATFLEHYDFVKTINSRSTEFQYWLRLDGEGYIKYRATPQVIKSTPGIVPDISNPNFCFSEVFLHIPWRSLDDLPRNEDEGINRFMKEIDKQMNSELQRESNTKVVRQNKLDLLNKASTSSSSLTLPPPEYVFVEDSNHSHLEIELKRDANTPTTRFDKEWITKQVYSSEDIDKARGFVKKVVVPWIKAHNEAQCNQNNYSEFANSSSNYRYPVSYCEEASTTEVMAESQWIPFALCMLQSRKRLDASLKKTKCEPLQMVINGEGGSGKSWLIKHIVKDIHTVYGEHSATRRTSKRVLLLAHQGTAAFNIKGQTICSAFGFSTFSRYAFSVPYTSLIIQQNGSAKLRSLQERFKTVQLVIIDEFSVVSCGMLYWIDMRMREIWPSERALPFGGRDVIFTGDSGQLDPVIPYALSTATSKINNFIEKKGRELWKSIPYVCTLTSQNRGKSDPAWYDALRRLRKKQPTDSDIALFNTRALKKTEYPDWASNAKHIAYRNVDVESANELCVATQADKIIHLFSHHCVQQKRLKRQRDIPNGIIKALLEDAATPELTRDRVVSTYLKLALGAPVSVTFNLEQIAGLCNGTNGVVHDLIFTPECDLPIVLVQITDFYRGPSFLDKVPNIVPIVPKEVSWSKKTSDFRVVRTGIPLRLAYAITVHKVQGLTCRKIVFHSLSVPNVSFAYVALSRVKTREDIILTSSLSRDKLRTSPEKLEEFQREEARVDAAVENTMTLALPIVSNMKEIARQHNKALRPR